MDILPNEADAIFQIEKQILKAHNEASQQVKIAIEDSYKRLLNPSIEAEVRLLSKKSAEEKAIKVFADNIRELLLAAPLGQKSILAIDPGFRSGCKVVALNKQGKLLESAVIYPHEPQRDTRTRGW